MIAGAVVAITLVLWLRWLIRRRVYWFERLTNAIPDTPERSDR